MPRVHDFAPAGNAGELSPRLYARTDFSKYPNALEICENIIPLSEGGRMRRPGTRYAAALKSSAVKGRLKSFQFSTTQAYVLELGAAIMRFYRHQAQISVADTDASVTNGTFDSNVTGWDNRSTGGGSIAHDSTNNDMNLVPGGATASDIGWAEQSITTTATDVEHVIKFRIVGDAGDRIEFQVGSSSTGEEIFSSVEREVGYHCIAFTPTASPFYIQFRNVGSNGNKTISIDDVSLIDNAPVEIDTPWGEDDLFTVEGPQSADVLYMFHGDYPTHKLERLGHTTWSLAEVAWQDGPWLPLNDTSTTLQPSATSGVGITITASSTTGINDNQGFLTTDIGRLVRLDNPSSGVAWGWGVITARASTTSVTVDVKEAFGGTTADTRWRLGAWSGTTGYPQTATFFEQRLYVAATNNRPQTFWASQTADFENHKPDDNDDTPEDDDALDYTLSGDSVNAIRWLSAGEDTLAIGTIGGEWVPSAQGAVLTPLDIAVRRQTTHGSAQIQPVRVGSVVLFVQTARRKLREFGFSFEIDGYSAPDMTRLAQHVTRGGIVEMAYAEEPNSLVYAVRGDGQLLTMTYRRDEDVVGWARHIIGGSYLGGNAVVESVTVIPGADGSGQVQSSESRDEVWIIVKRTINGATVRYVEVFEREFEDGDPQEDAYFSDSLITLDNPVTITGATAAKPVVVSAAAHGFSDGADVRITRVAGMAELNGNSYRIFDVATGSFSLADDAGKNVTAATQTNPVQVTIPGHGYANSESIAFFNVGGMTELNGNDYTVSVVDADNITIGVDGTGFTAYTSGGTSHAAVDGSAFTAYAANGQVREKVSAITGLDHLEGESARIWADGGVAPSETVSSGGLTLDTEASVIHAGLPYTHKFKTLKIEAGNPAGTAVGKIKRISAVTAVLLNSHVFSYGPDGTNLIEKEFREVSDGMDSATPLFSGEARLQFEGEYTTDARIVMQSDAPAPFTLLALAPEITVNPLT
jgi:hypothetical protein